ncbi:MAG: TRAP transporter substrate-binding protein DctP [Thermodesulfobacteriota bacterium]|nr:TRAP transporter substrate-binding protein DctP [Thermodesulfobacteriota bacterium]
MRLKRTFIWVFVFSILFFYFTGISNADSKKPTVLLKMATHAPLGIGIELFVRERITPTILSVTEGVVVPDWYHGGIMGGNEDWVVKMQIDQLQGAVLDGSGIHFACPQSVIMQLPFLFKNIEEITYVKGKIRKRLNQIFQKNGYEMLFLADQGPFDEIYSTKYELRKPEDFSKSRYLSYGAAVEYETIKALGGSPIHVSAPEVPSSIRSGICNAMFAVPLWWVGAQLYTMTKYITPTKIRYVMGGFVITEKAWKRIPEKYHLAIKEGIEELETDFNKRLANDNAKSLRAMFKYGVKEGELTQDEIEVLKKRTRSVWDRLAGKEYPRELLDSILVHLQEYRSKEATR